MPYRPRPGEAFAQQFAALAVKRVAGETLVMLVTSRETGRWVLPKGWAEKRLTGAKLAEKEAYEEAGIVGDAADRPLGAYHYFKQLSPGRRVECVVNVFRLEVTALLEDWPEARQRRREWFTLPQAAMKVDEGDLAMLLSSLAVHQPA